MSNPYYLNSPKQGDSRLALTLGQGLPTSIKVKVGDADRDIPVSYWRKDAIGLDKYRHQITGQTIDVTPEKTEEWVRNFRGMKAAGMRVPAPAGHSDDPRDNMGWVEDIDVKDERLSLLVQAIGEDGALVASRNECSLKIDPDYVDEKGKRWGSCIVHAAFTPKPVVTGMGSFVPFAASRGPAAETPIYYLSAEERNPDMDFKALREALGAPADVPDDKLLDKVRELKTSEATALSRATKAEGERDTAKAEVVTLSRKQPDPPAKPSASEIFFASKAVKAARDEAINAGAITPAVADQAEKTYLRKPVELAKITLSRAVEDDDHKVVTGIAALLDFYETVKGNKPAPPTGSQTGVQLLSRQVPGDNGEKDKPMTPERRKELLSQSPGGQAVLAVESK